jgi:hypothetical protein
VDLDNVQAQLFEVERRAIRQSQNRSFRQGSFCQRCSRVLDSKTERELSGCENEPDSTDDIDSPTVAHNIEEIRQSTNVLH